MKLSRRFPLNALRVFEAVARLENFTRAAEELGMTQTAVTYQIKLLEEFLGDTVFLRRPRALKLTETGEKLLPKVAEAFTLLTEAVQSTRHGGEDTLEIHSPPTFASQWLSPHLGAFQAEYPQIAVRLVRQMDATDQQRTWPDITIHIGAVPLEALVCHPLLRLEYSPMLAPHLADSVGGIRQPTDLLKLPWISDTRGWWREWFDAAGIAPGTIRQTGLNALGALDLEAKAAIAGDGVAMLSPFLFRDDLASGRLIQPFDLCFGDGKTYWLGYQPARRNTAKIKAFTTWIQSALAHDLAAMGTTRAKQPAA
ncbi:LysR substrate-binding domain-containing protein [Neorhizobium galegae]|uniref:LysR substrate-binding domain-containing protein n=1 Tax=Neorhizobium galegae TaxID=399 RepID=UPI000620F022|nr:LysR substrate-binding domain-containing protein [Neorhizobium galegae]UIK03979.1 LysR substrate-binding domain-containing protein [Neorhizobium galegae]CDZ60919.1 DNA-binding transcriptional activator GcvA [Neorhizobium galegae bv. orientalis]